MPRREEEWEGIIAKTRDWIDEFYDHPLFDRLTEDEETWYEVIVSTFIDYMYHFAGETPGQWEKEAVQEVCLNWMPRRLCADDAAFGAVVPVLSAFFTFLYQRGDLPQGKTLISVIKPLTQKIEKQARNEESWHPKKWYLMDLFQETGLYSSEEDGSLLLHEDELDEILLMVKSLDSRPDVSAKEKLANILLDYIMIKSSRDKGEGDPESNFSHFIHELIEKSKIVYEEYEDYEQIEEEEELDEEELAKRRQERTVVKKEEAGRNDPCPCGSGKKYKKCCLP